MACVLTLSPALVFAGHTPKPGKESGVIKSVDMGAHTFVVAEQHKKAEQTFGWNDQTKFTEHKKSASASALKAGEHVQFTYAPGGTPPVLQSVHITPEKAQKTNANKSTARDNSVKS